MMKKYKAKKATLRVVEITLTSDFYNDPWIKKIICIGENKLPYVRKNDLTLERIYRGDFLSKSKDNGVAIDDGEMFARLYEEA